MNNNSNLEVNKKEFRKIPSAYFFYEISEDGKTIRNVKSKRVIKQRTTQNGYNMVTLSLKGKRVHKTVHSLVAECWLGKRPEGFDIDHIDRNKTNNHYKNLRYVSRSENNLNRVISFNVPVRIQCGNEEKEFRTSKECAEYISKTTGKPYKSIRWKLSKRRRYILGYDIFYLLQRLDAAAPRGKEQSNKYLVGTLDRFNNAKRAEVKDRVKHSIV